jgi:Tat protein translocase TatC
MPFLDHLEELRWRILWSLLAVAVGTAVGWFAVQQVDVVEILKRPIAPYLPGGRLVFTSPAEPFLLTLKIALAAGCLLASPVVIYQIWAFLAPALYERERRLIVPALAVGVVLFIAGAVACYLWLFPAALKVFLSFQREDLTPMITIDRYFAMAVPFIAGCGAVAELPLVVTILASLGLVTPQFLARHRRYAIVVAAFVAAILTPPDALSMMLMLGPLLLLYEISIWCAWVASRRRARREAAASAGAATLVFLVLLGAGTLDAQGKPVPPDTQKIGVKPVTGQSVDTGTARRMGLPTAPTRSFPKADAVIDSLLKLQGYRVTEYVADSLIVEGDSLSLQGQGFVDREGTKLEAEVIRYWQASCRLDADGDPKLFDQGTVLVGEGMRYDTCIRRGTVRDALTNVQQGGASWWVRGTRMAVDSGSSRVYGAGTTFTSDDQPVPDYHFAAGQVKWLNKSTMVARPAVLYVRDVPVMWLPFIFQDTRSGRRSGILVPRFGLNDLVRPTRGYQRHVTDFGYYFAINDYMDLLVSADWYAGRYLSLRAAGSYNWLDRFVRGSLSYARTQQLDAPGASSHIMWTHAQQFDSRTSLNASVNYDPKPIIISRNSLNPLETTAKLNSSLNFSKRFAWGTLSIGGNRGQEISTGLVNQSFPTIDLTPASINVGSWMTWTPRFSFSNAQTFHNPTAGLLIPSAPGDANPLDTLPRFFGTRNTRIDMQTPLRIGPWNWSNSFIVSDVVSDQRKDFVIPDSTAPGGVRRVTYAQTFETTVDWSTGINLPSLFQGTWKLQPGIAIINTTSGPFMIKNQFTGGQFVRQGKRLAFNATLSPAFFAFFPGVGPLERIRHSVTPQISYQYAPGVKVPEDYARASDPEGRRLNSHIDPQQTITLSLSQNIEAKLKPPPGDTTSEPRKIRLLGINTSGISYNFEQAKQPHLTGWQTPTLVNTISSDLVRGFSVTLTHSLWEGTVGTDSARFHPFLTNVQFSTVTITPGTLRGIAALFGFALRHSTPESPAGPDTTRGPPLPGGGPLGGGGAGGYPGRGQTGPGGLGGSRQFSLTVGYSSSRSREDTTPQLRRQGGRQTTNLNLSFSPTAHWTANWTTRYDFGTRQFADHLLTFQRDLRRWRASFTFSKTATGNLAFSFNIALIDQSDIKFDYDQRSFAGP